MKIHAILPLIVLSSLLLLAGCGQIDVGQFSDEDIQRISNKVIVCEEPYIRYGTGCCLDANSNSICDQDETEAQPDKDEQNTYSPIIEEEPILEQEKDSIIEEQELQCEFPPGILCEITDFDRESGRITMEIRNGIGKTLTFGDAPKDLEAEDVDETFTCSVSIPKLTIDNGDSGFIKITCPEENLQIDDLNLDVKLRFAFGGVYGSGPAHTFRGEISVIEEDYEEVQDISEEIDEEEDIRIRLNDIGKYTSGMAGTRGNFFDIAFLKDGDRVNTDVICPTMDECSFRLVIDGEEEKEINRWYVGSNPFYYCEEGECLEDEFLGTHRYIVELIKENSVHSSNTIRITHEKDNKEELFLSQLRAINPYSSGPMGASGNTIRAEYYITEDTSSGNSDPYYVTSGPISLEEVCPTMDSCELELVIDGRIKRSLGQIFAGSPPFYFCREGSCLEDEFPGEHVARLDIIKDGKRQRSGSTTLQI